MVFYYSEYLRGEPLGNIFNEKRRLYTSWESLRGKCSGNKFDCLTFSRSNISIAGLPPERNQLTHQQNNPQKRTTKTHRRNTTNTH